MVFRLDYYDNGKLPDKEQFETPEKLREGLFQQPKSDRIQLRLYVVEDLSSDVIESLGYHYKINPDFFREHIIDFAWCNVRDPWRVPSNLIKDRRQQNWTQIRYVTPRYFETSKSFEDAQKEVMGWNVARRPDDDNNRAFWDKDDAIVALTRSKASFWLNQEDSDGGPAVGTNHNHMHKVLYAWCFADMVSAGVILLDPTIKKGFPLWRGQRNWQAAPIVGKERLQALPLPSGPSGESLLEHFMYWAEDPKRLNLNPADSLSADPNKKAQNIHAPIQILLQLICAEWLTVADYIKARLCQIDWEIAFPESFIDGEHDINFPLKKLHMWRRFVPLYREMLSETLENVFRFSCHRNVMKDFAAESHLCSCASRHAYGTEKLPPGAIAMYRDDFERALAQMKEYQERIDRLTNVVMASIGIKDSERAMSDNRNLGRLSWLATLFLPFSLVATTFCMQLDVSSITTETVKWYFITAVPLAAVVIGVATTLSLPRVQRFFKIANFNQ